MSRSSRATRLALIGLALTITLVGVLIASPPPAGEDDDTAGISTTTTTTAGITTTSTTTTSTTTTTTTTEPPYEGWADPRSPGLPYGETVEGLLTFRGNPTRSYYGEGPVPVAPEI